jgi:hypothetical protein
VGEGGDSVINLLGIVVALPAKTTCEPISILQKI